MADAIQRLKLRVSDAEDLAVVSACLQDAILPVADLAYFPDRQELVFVANRFCWSKSGDDGCDWRIHCGVTVSGVLRAQVRNVDLRRRDRFFALLALQLENDRQGLSLMLACSDNRAIRLRLALLDLRLEDMGDPWLASRRPCHPVD